MAATAVVVVDDDIAGAGQSSATSSWWPQLCVVRNEHDEKDAADDEHDTSSSQIGPVPPAVLPPVKLAAVVAKPSRLQKNCELAVVQPSSHTVPHDALDVGRVSRRDTLSFDSRNT